MKKHDVSNTTIAVLLILAILVSVIGAWTVVEHANQKIEKVQSISVMENSNQGEIKETPKREDISEEDGAVNDNNENTDQI